jgi:hypothetical protein
MTTQTTGSQSNNQKPVSQMPNSKGKPADSKEAASHNASNPSSRKSDDTMKTQGRDSASKSSNDHSKDQGSKPHGKNS